MKEKTAVKFILSIASILFAFCAVCAQRPTPSRALRGRLAEGVDVIGIVHWGLNTYTDREWGYGDENPMMLNPTAFDADQIVNACKSGGLKGLVVVAKHHDGFCLFDSKYTDFKATNTPAGRDLLREIVDAFRAEGIRVGFYYSLIDWHHPQCVIDNKIGPYRNLSEEEMAKIEWSTVVFPVAKIIGVCAECQREIARVQYYGYHDYKWRLNKLKTQYPVCPHCKEEAEMPHQEKAKWKRQENGDWVAKCEQGDFLIWKFGSAWRWRYRTYGKAYADYGGQAYSRKNAQEACEKQKEFKGVS